MLHTSRWWILAALRLDFTLAARSKQLDVASAMETSRWSIVDTVETPSWRAADTVSNTNVVGAAPVTSALASLGMSIIFYQFHATLVKYRFPRSNCVKPRITLLLAIFMTI
jgi:hypothetical protein